MTSSPPHDYSAYLAEHDRIQSPSKPLGLEAYLLLREKLDELTLLELQEGMIQGMDKESLETLTQLTQTLLEEAPGCPPAPSGNEILAVLLAREDFENNEWAELFDEDEELLDEEEEQATEPCMEELLTELLGLTPLAPDPEITPPEEGDDSQSFEISLSKSRAPSPPRGRAPASKMRRELWRLNRRRGQG